MGDSSALAWLRVTHCPFTSMQVMPWDPLPVLCGISFVLFDCSPRTRLCWKVWVTSCHSSSKPRKLPQRSYRESKLCTLCRDGPWGPVWYLRARDDDAFPISEMLIIQSRILQELCRLFCRSGCRA